MTMNDQPVRVIATGVFIRAAKRLRKKYPHLSHDLHPLTEQLQNGETPGDRLQNVEPFIVYKVRVPNTDAQRGKSGGYRVIYYCKRSELVFLVYIVFQKRA